MTICGAADSPRRFCWYESLMSDEIDRSEAALLDM